MKINPLRLFGLSLTLLGLLVFNNAQAKETTNSTKLVYDKGKVSIAIVCDYYQQKSHCVTQGMNNNQAFSYDISAVENQNIGKVTNKFTNIRYVRTYPMKWVAVKNDDFMVLMQTVFYINHKKFTTEEPLVIDYKKGMIVR